MPSPKLTDVKIDGWKTTLIVGPGLFSVASRQFQGVRISSLTKVNIFDIDTENRRAVQEFLTTDYVS